MIIKNVQLTVNMPQRYPFIEDAFLEAGRDPFIKRLINSGRQITSYIVITQNDHETELLLNFE